MHQGRFRRGADGIKSGFFCCGICSPFHRPSTLAFAFLSVITIHMRNRIKNTLFGVLVAAVAFTTIGAAPRERKFVEEIGAVRFIVLEVTPKADEQTVVIRLTPWYGKMGGEPMEFRREHATPELSIVTHMEEGYDLKRGDILDFRVSDHLKLGPKSSVVRQIPAESGHIDSERP